MRGRARQRRRGNAPWGSTEAEVRQIARRNARSAGSRKHPMSRIGGSGLVLGRLTELVVKRAGGDTRLGEGKLRGLYLAWMPRRKQLAIVRRVGTKRPVTELDARARDIFKRFHQTKPQRAMTYDWPTASNLRRVGLLRSLTYVVPEEIRSPGKRGFKWVHAFGDHGERGHGPHTGTPVYPDHLMPALCKDENGNLHIVRRAGNKYDVTEWIYW